MSVLEGRDNSLSPVCTAHMFMSVGLSTGAWAICQRHTQRMILPPQQLATNSSSGVGSGEHLLCQIFLFKIHFCLNFLKLNSLEQNIFQIPETVVLFHIQHDILFFQKPKHYYILSCATSTLNTMTSIIYWVPAEPRKQPQSHSQHSIWSNNYDLVGIDMQRKAYQSSSKLTFIS